MEQDILATLSYYRTHALPEEEEKRIDLLHALICCNIFYIYYEDLCEYSPFFKETYPIERIKKLFRTHHILGNNIKKEIDECSASEEEKVLMRFFFKGKIVQEE